MNKRITGGGYEKTAAEYLEKQNVEILYMNFRCKIGEIDIIGRDKDTLVFYEVKYRSSDYMGSPKEAINIHKIHKICRVSDFYRFINRIDENTKIRFDVISIKGEEIEWIKDAFEYI